MSSGRYNRRVTRFNRSEIYEELRASRGVKQVNQYLTQRIHTLTQEELSRITTVQHVWKTGDRFYKLAFEYYSNAEYWWIIAWFNQRPTENHVNLGDMLYIPFPPSQLASLYSKNNNGG